MESFEGRVAVVTGGGTGMGRELVGQLAAQGCHVATCDVDDQNLAESAEIARSNAPAGTRVTTSIADVSDEAALLAFRQDVSEAHGPHVNLLFNNAGIGGGGSLIGDEREEWEKVFNVTWGGVYLGTRVFLPMLLAAPEGHVVNTSSINGFWASLGLKVPHTAYSAAKFAVKGFTEALMRDFEVNAPHLRASVVMPGHIGTSIMINSSRVLGRPTAELTPEQLEERRQWLTRMGMPAADVPDDVLRKGLSDFEERFRDAAPTTAAEAAATIIDGVRRGEWRILVGEDAHVLDQMVRDDPTAAYTPEFLNRVYSLGHLGNLIP